MTRLLAWALALGVGVIQAVEAGPPVTRDAILMGTRARLVVEVETRDQGLLLLQSALDALERTERQLSTWRDDSAMSIFNRRPVGEWMALDAPLCQMWREVDRWRVNTAGAFDPAVGALVEAWDLHGTGRVPEPAVLDAARGRTGSRWLDFDAAGCRLARRGLVTLDVGAFGKGEGLDRAAAVLAGRRWLIDLGGQVSVGVSAGNRAPWGVDVADPRDRGRPALRLRIAHGSLSTSAGSERDLAVNGTRVGHILDPATGSPATFEGSVSVWHERALVADILSTALYVMGPEVGVTWARARGLAVVYLIPDGPGLRVLATPAFQALLEPVAAVDAGHATSGGAMLTPRPSG